MPGAMGVRHFVPLAFVLSLIVLPLLSLVLGWVKYLLIAELAAYLLLDVLFSAKAANNPREFFALLFLFPLFHISYGVGSLEGIATLVTSKKW